MITRELVQSVVGNVTDWNEFEDRVRFRTFGNITLAKLTELSKVLETDRINFWLGYSGTPEYSDFTPSNPGEPGFIEVFK
jgi:hypothetical protein